MKRIHGINLSKWGFAFYFGTTLIWLRWGERVYAARRGPLIFSERYGYRKYKPLPFGWRLIDIV